MSGFWDWQIAFKDRYLNYVISDLEVTQYIYDTRYQMTSTCIDAYMVTSDDALTHPSEGPGADANGLTGIENSMMKCVFISNWSCIHYGF